jgi:hypothetical protein
MRRIGSVRLHKFAFGGSTVDGFGASQTVKLAVQRLRKRKIHGGIMKKILTLSLMLGTIGFFAPGTAVNAAPASAAAADPQIRVQIGPNRRNRRNDRRWNNRRVRTYTQTRVIRIGRHRYREVIRVTQLPNGRTMTQVISRTRLGRW